MKIMHLIHQFAPERSGGAERHLLQLAREQKSRHDLLIYTQSVTHSPTGATDEIIDGIKVRRFHDRSPKARYELQKDLLKKAGEFAPDILHIHHGIGFGADTLLNLVKNRPTVITLHDYWWMCPQIRLLFKGDTPCPGPDTRKRCPDCYKGGRADLLMGEASYHLEKTFFAPFVKIARINMSEDRPANDSAKPRSILADLLGRFKRLRKAFFKARAREMKNIFKETQAIIAPSQYLAARYREAEYPIHENKLHFIPYGINESEFAPKADFAENKPLRFALVGHLNREKGVDLAVGAFENIDPGAACLDLHGPADLSERSREIAGRKPEQIRLHGPFAAGQAATIYENIDALIIPSIWVENAPKVLHEAFAAGVPVIASDHGALPEFVGEKRGGFLFKAHDALNLRSVIQEITDKPEILEKARASIPKTVDIVESSRIIDEIYEEVTSGR